jgi:hypothetical protein
MNTAVKNLERLKRKVPEMARDLQPIYKKLGWKWISNKGMSPFNFSIPDTKRISSILHRLIKHTMQIAEANGHAEVSGMGGITVKASDSEATIAFSYDVTMYKDGGTYWSGGIGRC